MRPILYKDLTTGILHCDACGEEYIVDEGGLAMFFDDIYANIVRPTDVIRCPNTLGSTADVEIPCQNALRFERKGKNER